MKTKTMALAVLLLASAGTAAMAQDNQHQRGHGRGGWSRDEAPGSGGASNARSQWTGGDRPQRVERPQFRQEAATPPTPPQPPQAREAPAAGGRFQPNADGRRNWPGRGGWTGDGGAVAGRTGADGQDDEDRDELRQARQWGGRQGERWAFEGDRRAREQPQPQRPQSGWDRRNGGQNGDQNGGRNWTGGDRQGQDRNRGDWNRNGQDRNGQDRNRGDRRDDHRDDRNRGDWSRNDRHSWDGDRRDSHGQPRWDRRNYPPVYQSQRRYRGPAWRPPVGFYVRSWAFGDYLPRGWFADDYRIWDWWSYGLPMPPPGYSWVRVGYDALLVDDFDGEVVQVVRLLFW